MKIALSETRQGLQRARNQVNVAANRIARWGTTSQIDTGDTVQLNGQEQPRYVL